MLPPSATRAARHTARHVNEAIRDRTERSVQGYHDAQAPAIDRRLAELDREWDIERTLQANFGVLSLTGLLLGIFVDRRWHLLPATAAAFMVQHSLQGWCPPLPLFRRLGVRTLSEINRERQELQRLRDAGRDTAQHGPKLEIP